jgi:hypothetical protein
MIFSGIYFYLELNQFDRGYDTGSLSITVRRKNSSYFNQEGINIVIDEFENGDYVNTSHIYSWYTQYNPNNTPQQEIVPFLDSEPIVIVDDTFEGIVAFGAINNKTIFNGKRFGKKIVRVRLLRNVTNEVFIEGLFKLTTLEIALPTIHRFNAKTVGKKIKIDFKGVNPPNFGTESQEEKLYLLRISSTLSSTPIVENVDNEVYENLIPIVREYYEKQIFVDGIATGEWETKTKTDRTVNFYAEWYIPSVVEQQLINEGTPQERLVDVEIEPEISILRKQFVYQVPNFALGITTKVNDEHKKVAAMYQKINGEWRKVVKVYQKIGGAFLSQD